MNQPDALIATAPDTAFAEWRDYFALLKPRVMILVVFTAACAMAVAPGTIHPFLGFVAILCIAVAAGAAGALNQWYEADIDALMKRTASRPLPAGKMEPREALNFAIALSVGSVTMMGLATNWVAAFWLAVSILFYVIVYTVWLKRRTPQNIVIGGAAGAFPVIVGWAAVAGDTSLLPWLLFAIIFLWTPPHFWALALFMEADYSKAGVPMLPVTHGLAHTRKQILGYSALLVPITIAPAVLGLTGWAYGGTAVTLGIIFLAMAVKVARSHSARASDMAAEKQLFKFSLLYLACLFGALVADRLLLA
ncbi:heme o synthase [Polymorphobacter fuscus]|uniref:Protoheme IX farnesyltransferase n=1 Tax=Sandarakinorhabdus fusca TaxID=1439888 RepID=A0A7C9KWM0_9SPHN|nr:heme o synthase [Polymorphobacter fuscus]KAB7647502.1 protoheme IX farnesyltransferase [Polymorphobacter fuscus]MQT16762.1 protoheme IX farnesyltransferase [Polymorphobacter fuscus]NJC09250.1 protoheme IX farnesyltransferase [Polymorphobacter fuscus]